MIAVKEFTVDTDQVAHYRAIHAKFRGPPQTAPAPVNPLPGTFIASVFAEPPKPVASLEEEVGIPCLTRPNAPRFVFIEEVYPEVVEEDAPEVRRPLAMKEILLLVARTFKIHPFDITSARRKEALVRARHALYYFLREYTRKSLPEIGDFVGGRDHTTVISGIKRTLQLIENDPEFREKIEAVRGRLERMAA